MIKLLVVLGFLAVVTVLGGLFALLLDLWDRRAQARRERRARRETFRSLVNR